MLFGVLTRALEIASSRALGELLKAVEIIIAKLLFLDITIFLLTIPVFSCVLRALLILFDFGVIRIIAILPLFTHLVKFTFFAI